MARLITYSLSLINDRPTVTVATGDTEDGPVPLTKAAFTSLRTWTLNNGLTNAVTALDAMKDEMIADLQRRETELRAEAADATASAADATADADQIKATYEALQA